MTEINLSGSVLIVMHLETILRNQIHANVVTFQGKKIWR